MCIASYSMKKMTDGMVIARQLDVNVCKAINIEKEMIRERQTLIW